MSDKLNLFITPPSEKIIEDRERLHNEEFYNLYSSPNITRVIKLRRKRWAGQVACKEYTRGVKRVFVGRSEGKKPLGRHRIRVEDNSKIHFQDVGCASMDWINLAAPEKALLFCHFMNLKSLKSTALHD
jgi:hypothetical protein